MVSYRLQLSIGHITKILLVLSVLFLIPSYLSAQCSGACCGANNGSYTCATCTHGETGQCRAVNTCNQSDVQNAVTDSSAGTTGYAGSNSFAGDGVYVPAGSCSWSSSVSWTNKNINLIGNSPTIKPSGDAFDVEVGKNGPTGAAFHISGFNFTGSPSGDIVNLNGGLPASLTGWAGYFRIDHITANLTSSGNVFIIYGPVWGLFDHLNITTPNNIFEQANLITSEYNAVTSGTYSELEGEYGGRILPEALGTENAIYIENSTFTETGNYSGAVTDSESGGERMVYRYNTCSGTCFHYAHWTRGSEWDGDKYEIYDNTYTGNANAQYAFRFGSGTGVIFNNTLTSYSDKTVHVDETRGCGGESTNPPYYSCDGTQALDGNAGDTNAPGWPCAGQIGTGCSAGSCTRSTMNSIPLLVWNNGTQSTCATGGNCTNAVTVLVDGSMGSNNSCTRTMSKYIKSTAHSVPGALNGAVDYCQGSTMPTSCGIYTNTYTPYTYPHPLQGPTGGPLPPMSPKGTVVVVPGN